MYTLMQFSFFVPPQSFNKIKQSKLIVHLLTKIAKKKSNNSVVSHYSLLYFIKTLCVCITFLHEKKATKKHLTPRIHIL